MTDQPKRRGRPPKSNGCPECGQAVGHYDDCPVGLAVPSAAQAYARRVWAGQSLTIPRGERLRRVGAALAAQGMSMEGVTLP